MAPKSTQKSIKFAPGTGVFFDRPCFSFFCRFLSFCRAFFDAKTMISADRRDRFCISAKNQLFHFQDVLFIDFHLFFTYFAPFLEPKAPQSRFQEAIEQNKTKQEQKNGPRAPQERPRGDFSNFRGPSECCSPAGVHRPAAW